MPDIKHILTSLFVIIYLLISACFSMPEAVAQKPGKTEPDAGIILKDFIHPPDSFRPHVYWYWMDDNITREGIKLDLGSKYDEIQIRIFDFSGKQLLVRTYYETKIIDLNLEHYEPGIYIVEAAGATERHNIKVMKLE